MKPTLPDQAEYTVSAPGRVNLLGEHVDYNQGVVLPVAIDRRVVLHAHKLSEPVIRLQASDINDHIDISLSSLHQKLDIENNPLPAWALYPAGVAWALQQKGFQPIGIEATFSSDIPIGAGLSSSAAVEIAFAALWQSAGEWKLEPIEMALICQQAEIEYVGVNCGAMDQIAIACGIQDHVLQIDLRSMQCEAIPLPKDVVIIIADSGVRRSLANSAYNERRAACERAVQILKQQLPSVESLRDVTIEAFTRYSSILPESIHPYAKHVVEEMARVEEGICCLKTGNVDGFGRLMLAGHASLRDLFMVSIPELNTLVEIARDSPGCWGARLTGAGFGGCTVNLVEARYVEEFSQNLSSQYENISGKTAHIYTSRASQGVTASINKNL